MEENTEVQQFYIPVLVNSMEENTEVHRSKYPNSYQDFF